MTVGTRRILSGLMSVALAAALTVPALAAEENGLSISFGPNGVSETGDTSAMDMNQQIPSLGMTYLEAIIKSGELELDYKAATDEAERSRILVEIRAIDAALRDAGMGTDFAFLKELDKEAERSVSEYVDLFNEDGMQLMFAWNEWTTMYEQPAEKPSLTEEQTATYLRWLQGLEGASAGASSAEKEEIRKALQTFVEVAAPFQNSEAVIAAINSFLAKLALPEQPAQPTASLFSDVPADAWYAQDVAEVQALGILQGKGDGQFDPGGQLTVAEAITLAAKTRAYYNGETIPAVEGGEWYSGAEAYATAQGVIQDPFPYARTANAQRTQMAYLFANALPASEYPAINHVTALPDVAESGTGSTQFSEQIFRLYDAGILTGSDEFGSFRPDAEITRAEAAVILNRLVHPEKRVVQQFVPFEGDM